MRKGQPGAFTTGTGPDGSPPPADAGSGQPAAAAASVGAGAAGAGDGAAGACVVGASTVGTVDRRAVVSSTAMPGAATVRRWRTAAAAAVALAGGSQAMAAPSDAAPTVEERAARIRAAIAEMGERTAVPGNVVDAAQRQQLAQWFNFPNWPNFWNNWRNFWPNF